MSARSRGFPLFLTFDIDAETMWTARDPAFANRPVLMSQGAYGWKTGVWRIMDLLRRYGIHTTFFIPGLVVEQRPQVVEALLKDGHEIAHHSYTHAWVTKLTPEQEHEEMERGFEAIKRATGYAPRGYRSPVGEVTPTTLKLISEYGFSYTSNFADSDAPYLLEIDGKRTEIVELCWRWVMDDAAYYLYHPGVLGGRSLGDPNAVMQTWMSEFDVLHTEPDSMMMVAMHPQLTGQPSRLKALEGFVKYALSHNDVRIERCDKMTDEMRTQLVERI
jgi:peptidoglycan/xylan/chitin deacetylase (PgdA/CDA1 family)